MKEEWTTAFLRDGENLDVLKRENIQIIQSSSVFSFSLDAVLLADFANLPRKRKATIVDLCTGTGAVAFLMTAKTENPIIGVDVQKQVIDMAKRTVALNQLEDRVSFLQHDIKDITNVIRPDSVDVITCNPPYFKDIETSTKNNLDSFTIARHEVLLPLGTLLEQVSKLLKMNGKVYMVHRPDRLLDIIAAMRANRLALKKLRFIHPLPDKEANMVLLEAIKDGSEDGLHIIPPLYVHEADRSYSKEVQAILHGE